MEIRGISISYASYKKKSVDKKEKELENEIEEIESNPILQNIPSLLEDRKAELTAIRQNKIKGIMLQSKARWVEEGEKPTKYFYTLESRNYTNKTIQNIELPDGNIIYDQEQILNLTKSFYENLYRSHENEIETIDLKNLLRQYEVPKLNNTEANQLEGKILKHEIHKVLKKMKNNKSPGADGFAAEFF